MNIVVKLDCKAGNQTEFFRHQTALLVSVKAFKDYRATEKVLIGIEPEKYVEQWMQCSIQAADKSFEDLVLIYFTKILQATQK